MFQLLLYTHWSYVPTDPTFPLILCNQVILFDAMYPLMICTQWSYDPTDPSIIDGDDV